MAWALAAALMMAPAPATVMWKPPSPPGSGIDETWSSPSLPGSGMNEPITEDYGTRWERRRRHLTRSVAVFGTMTGAGALLMGLPLMGVGGRGADGTSVFPIVATGAALFTCGGAVTTVLAPFLGHHVRWDHPSYFARTTPSQAAYLSRRHTRRLFIALGIEGGVVLAGGLSVGMGFVASSRCPAEDDGCWSRRQVAGGLPGFTMIGLGSLAMVSTGILIGLQKRHGHTQGSGPQLAGFYPGGVKLRF